MIIMLNWAYETTLIIYSQIFRNLVRWTGAVFQVSLRASHWDLNTANRPKLVSAKKFFFHTCAQVTLRSYPA